MLPSAALPPTIRRRPRLALAAAPCPTPVPPILSPFRRVHRAPTPSAAAPPPLCLSPSCRIIDEPLDLPEEVQCSAALRSLLCGMLEKDPQRRMRMDEVMKHPWVTNNGRVILK